MSNFLFRRFTFWWTCRNLFLRGVQVKKRHLVPEARTSQASSVWMGAAVCLSFLFPSSFFFVSGARFGERWEWRCGEAENEQRDENGMEWWGWRKVGEGDINRPGSAWWWWWWWRRKRLPITWLFVLHVHRQSDDWKTTTKQGGGRRRKWDEWSNDERVKSLLTPEEFYADVISFNPEEKGKTFSKGLRSELCPKLMSGWHIFFSVITDGRKE